MEDAATAEISRAQVWQWLHHNATLADGRARMVRKDQRKNPDYIGDLRDFEDDEKESLRTAFSELYGMLLEEEMDAIRSEVGDERFATGHFQLAMRLFDEMIRADDFSEFLTLPAYQYL